MLFAGRLRARPSTNVSNATLSKSSHCNYKSSRYAALLLPAGAVLLDANDLSM